MKKGCPPRSQLDWPCSFLKSFGYPPWWATRGQVVEGLHELGPAALLLCKNSVIFFLIDD